MHSTRWCVPPRPLDARDRRAMELGIHTEEVEMQVRELRKSVDLEGQLSNPAKPLKTPAAQGPRTVGGSASGHEQRSNPRRADTDTVPQQRLGHYSNPALVQPTADSPEHVERAIPTRRRGPRRLRASEVDEMVAAYVFGDTVNDLAQRFGVHRTTVMAHLKRRETKRLATSKARWDDDSTRQPAYTDGASVTQAGPASDSRSL